MAITRATVPDSEDIWGKHRVIVQDITLDTSYTTGGYSLVAGDLHWSQLDTVEVIGGNSASGGYRFNYDTANKKLMAFVAAGATPAGTVAAPTITVAEGAVTVVGGGIGEAIGINPDSNAGVLSKAAATNRTIPRATLLGSATTATASAPAFTGTAIGAAALAQVANGVNLSTVTVRARFVGI